MANDHQPVPFGIGCIYFALNERGNSPWEDAVMSTLSSIPGVSGVEIDLGVVLPQEAQAGTGYYPSRGMLRFSLRVPMDRQQELQLPGAFQSSWEHFIVFIYFGYFEPVTFVLPYGATSASDAAPAVLVVRRYLQEQFSRQDYFVDLRVVAPSPFHVESCIKPGRTSEIFGFSHVHSQGYEELSFLYSRRRFSSSALAVVHLFKSISEELSLFYSLISRQQDRSTQRTEIIALTQGLIDIYQDRSFKARVLRIVTSSAKMRRVTLKAVLAEYQVQDDKRVAQRQIEELYSSDVVSYFKDFVEGEVDFDYTDEISAAKEVISLLDQARQRQVGTTSLFLSAIAGGLAGTIISLWVH